MRLLGVDAPSFAELFDASRVAMRDAYPDVEENWDRTSRLALGEEETFLSTLVSGTTILDTAVAETKKAGATTLPGDTTFLLHDTFGFPIDLTLEMAAEQGLQVDAEAGSGDITLRSLTGPLNLTAGSGDVDASGLAGKKVVAEAGSGNIELKYTTAPDSAELEAGSGDVTLHVPDGSYDVKTEVGSGDTNVAVGKDPNSPRKLLLTAGSGDVNVLAG